MTLDLVGALAALAAGTCPGRPALVAIDGPDAAGKTTLADAVGAALRLGGRDVVRIGIDDFHQPADLRRRRGALSPEGYYLDSFDYAALRRWVVEPFGPGGDRRFRRAAFDYRSDSTVDSATEQAAPDAVVLVDGVFLLRPELRGWWHLAVHLDVSPAETLRRALRRDVELFGSQAAVRERYEARYLPAQRLYRAEARPHEVADVVVRYDDPARPVVVRWPGMPPYDRATP